LTPSILVETDSFQRWLGQHSESCLLGSNTEANILWPTPTAHDSQSTGPSQLKRHEPGLAALAVLHSEVISENTKTEELKLL
jgi:hypothetical protein